MRGSLLRAADGFLTGGGYLTLLMVSAGIDTPEAWRWTLPGVAVLALVGWRGALKRSRAVADTPTSTIAAAAQGYVELQGRGEAQEGMPLLSPVHLLPCVWYHHKVEKEQNDKWVVESTETSTASFWINDGTGRCLVDPEEAEVLTQRTDSWRSGNRRYTQRLLLAGEALYALGHFGTEGAATLALSEREDMARLLTEWKEDMPALVARYDRNGDGTIDLEEWEAARADALAAVQAEHRHRRAMPDTHTLNRNTGGRPFIISSLAAARVERRYRWWTLGHVAVFLASLGGCGYVWNL
ncbi:MAG: hypothetical protein RL323_1261 [Pseudomonadota bacterium]|jgi:hypothetical protein